MATESTDSHVQSAASDGQNASTAATQNAKSASHDPAGKEVSQRLLALVLETLDDNKVEEIVSIDLEGKSAIADAMVIGSGRSARHVSSSADHLLSRIKQEGFAAARVEGLAQGDWVLIDGGDVVVHLFRPEVREFYKLEKMWAADVNSDEDDAERVALS